VAFHEQVDGPRPAVVAQCSALRGRKNFVVNADRAGDAIVLAATGEGESLFVVDTPADRAGRVAAPYRTLGLRGCRIGDLDFDGCRVDQDNLLGEWGYGGEIAAAALEARSSLTAAVGLGSVDAALFDVVRFAAGRRIYGGHVIDLPHARETMAGAFADLMTCELLVRSSTRTWRRSPTIWLLVSRMLEDAVARISVVLGARFYLRSGDHAIFGKHYRDVLALSMIRSTEATLLHEVVAQLRESTLPELRVGDVEFDVDLRVLDDARSTVVTGLPDMAEVADLSPEACRLAELYAVVLAACEVAEHRRMQGDAAWSALAMHRLAERVRGTRTASPRVVVDAAFDDLIHRAQSGLGFDLAARPVLRTLERRVGNRNGDSGTARTAAESAPTNNR
jgi:hypothetical protein